MYDPEVQGKDLSWRRNVGLNSMLTECNAVTLGENTSEVRHRVRRTEAEHCLGLSVLESLQLLAAFSILLCAV